MNIGKPKLAQRKGQTILQTPIRSSEGERTLWYSIPTAFENMLSDTSDAALLSLLIPAMAANETIHIKGMVSERLLYHLRSPYQILLRKVIPSLHKVSIEPEETYSKAQRGPAVATGFSGGIDSYCVLADHFYNNPLPTFKVTHLIFSNVGSHCRHDDWFKARYERAAATAKRIGLPIIRVDSNIESFYGKGLTYQMTTPLRNTCVALLLQNKVGRFMHASTHHYGNIFVGPARSTAFSELISEPMLSTERFDALSVGSEYTRVEKTLKVSEIEDSYDTLDVCISPERATTHINCSVCKKCLRTQLTLDIAGKLGHYESVFDLDAYMQEVPHYTVEKDEPFSLEIERFAKEHKCDWRKW